VNRRRLALRGPLDLGTTLAPLVHGRGDRTIRLARNEAFVAMRVGGGLATLHLSVEGPAALALRAWGSTSEAAEAAIAGAAELVGESDEPERLTAVHPVLRNLQRSNPGLRLPMTRRPFAALLPAILEQKVTGTEAFRSYAALIRAHGEPAPGPAGLMVPPAGGTLAGLPYHAFHPFGVERRRADVIRRAAARAQWLEAAPDPPTLGGRLRSIPGIGPWTTAEVLRVARGDPDAVSIGDYHVPSVVSWALAGEPRATDERMLEILEPYVGQRGRVQRLLEVGGITPPRYGPRNAPREIAAI
jgi:3-methyladenine DNA glycosylase/8-oxoguanine DNA glycosylase